MSLIHAKILRELEKADPELKKLFKTHGVVEFKPKLKRSPYESLCRAIAHQQLHGKAAETILGRMITHFDGFPKPEQLKKINAKKLRSFGFSENKSKALKDIATKTLDGTVPTAKIILKMSNEDIIENLTKIYGVGKWTVEMLLIFQLGRLDVWPIDDFGVRNGYRYFKKLKQIPTAKEVKFAADLWKPYQSIVSLYLWREADLRKSK